MSALGLGWRRWGEARDTARIAAFLSASGRETDFDFRSTEAIAAATNLTVERVARLCSRSPAIRRNERKKESWRLA